jgi:hypothetical protein
MLAEALIALNKSELVMPWLECYKSRLTALPPVQNSITEENYRSALGDINRFSDWQAYFLGELREMPWNQVLNKWVDRLAPGLIAAAMHGVIRTGHAVRGLSSQDPETGVKELSNGLAYWAARYQVLPEANKKKVSGAVSVYEALDKLVVLPDAQRHNGSLITEEVEDIEGTPTFRDTIDYFDVDTSSPDATLSRLTEGFAFVFTHHAARSGNVIALVHALTGPYALRHMLPSLDTLVAKRALRYAWQAAAALYVRYALLTKPDRSEEEFTVSSESELVENAVASRDEHAVKFTEACLSEHRLNANPIYLTAAANCCEYFGRISVQEADRAC